MCPTPNADLVAENKRLRERLDKLLLKKPTGPRAQVVTLADCVETNEGYRYGLPLQQTEERELDLLAKLGRLQKAWNRYEADCRPETRNEFLAVAKAELNDGTESAPLCQWCGQPLRKNGPCPCTHIDG